MRYLNSRDPRSRREKTRLHSSRVLTTYKHEFETFSAATSIDCSRLVGRWFGVGLIQSALRNVVCYLTANGHTNLAFLLYMQMFFLSCRLNNNPKTNQVQSDALLSVDLMTSLTFHQWRAMNGCDSSREDFASRSGAGSDNVTVMWSDLA